MISLLQISFSHLHLATWMLSIPVVALLIAGYWRWRKAKLRQLADKKLLPGLLANYDPRLFRWSNGLLLIAITLLCIALVNPQKPGSQQSGTMKGVEVMLAVDVSKSMMAKDMGTTRLEAVQKLAAQLIDTLKGSQVGLVGFAGNAWLQLPLTTDLAAAKIVLASLDTESAPEAGSNLEMAMTVGYESLPLSAPVHKALVMFTDGEALDGEASTMAAQLKEAGILLILAGAGTEKGAPLIGPTGQPLIQGNGSPILSQLHAESLRQLANTAGGQYVAMNENPEALAQILAPIEKLPSQPMLNSYLVNFSSFAHPIIALAMLLLAIGTYLQTGKGKNHRKKQLAAGLLVAVCMALPPQAGIAQTTADLLAKANKQLQAGNSTEAANLYKQVIQQEPGNWQAQLHLGNIAYHNADYGDALKYYKTAGKQTLTNEAKVIVLNNQGLAQVKMDRMQDAVASFKQALKEAPFDQGIQNNLNMALRELEDNQEKKQPPPSSRPLNQQKTANKLQELQQEENEIRQKLKKQKKPVPATADKYW